MAANERTMLEFFGNRFDNSNYLEENLFFKQNENIICSYSYYILETMSRYVTPSVTQADADFTCVCGQCSALTHCVYLQ